MKRILSIFGIAGVAGAMLTGCPSNAEHRITGQWDGEDANGVAASFSFNKNHSLEMTRGDQSLTGRWEATSKGDTIVLALSIDGDGAREITLLAEPQDFRTIKLLGGTDLKFQPDGSAADAAYVATLQRPAR